MLTLPSAQEKTAWPSVYPGLPSITLSQQHPSLLFSALSVSRPYA
jgi:hypothetical protein